MVKYLVGTQSSRQATVIEMNGYANFLQVGLLQTSLVESPYKLRPFRSSGSSKDGSV